MGPCVNVGQVQADALRRLQVATCSGDGTAAEGATFTQVDAMHWSINSTDGQAQDGVTFTNATGLHVSDYPVRLSASAPSAPQMIRKSDSVSERPGDTTANTVEAWMPVPSGSYDRLPLPEL